MAVKPFIQALDDGELRFNFHAGHHEAFAIRDDTLLLLAGTQSGKTIFGPVWMLREIREQGPGDYMIVTPTYPLLEIKALPAFRYLFETMLGLGEYKASPIKHFELSKTGNKRAFGKEYNDKTNVYFGHASDPESLESATVKAIWMDEPGQRKFKLGSWEACKRRLSIYGGRKLLTTTPYDLGWLKQEVHDRAMRGDAGYKEVHFNSLMNPAFPREQYEKARREMPPWKFDLFYRAIFTRPAGVIYDCFAEEDIVDGVVIGPDWPRYMGIDFGGVHTCAVFYAQMPMTQDYYLYRCYMAGSRSAKEHVAHLLKDEPAIRICAGGSMSEGQWRREFGAAGLFIRPPLVTDVEVGIDRVYAMHSAHRIKVVRNESTRAYLEEKRTYSRELDEKDNPTQNIQDKNDFHHMDAERYIMSHISKDRKPTSVGQWKG